MSASLNNPFPGPRPFREGETLYGRDREAAELVDVVVAHRRLLLHAPSGAGKTSVLQASVLPGLREEGFDVLPVARVSRPLPSTSDANRYVQSVIDMIDEGLPEAQALGESARQGMHLHRYLKQVQEAAQARSDGAQRYVVLVLDQLEEVLTLKPSDARGRQTFFSALEQVFALERVACVLVTRDLAVAELDAALRRLRRRPRARIRLDRLDRSGARAAITGPIKEAGAQIEPAAVEALLDRLSGASPDETSASSIEPVHLQIVCRRIWEVARQDGWIRANAVEAWGQQEGDVASAVDRALAEHYDTVLARWAEEHTGALRAPGVERALREWIGTYLLTPEGARTPAPRDAFGGISGPEEEALQSLMDDRILAPAGDRWIELAHDRLAAPVLASNRRWFAKRAPFFRAEAQAWVDGGRDETLVLTGRRLDDAYSQMTQSGAGWTAGEREYVQASAIAQKKALRRNALRTGGAIALIAVVLIVMWQRQTMLENKQLESENKLLTLQKENGRARIRALETQQLTAAIGDALEAIEPGDSALQAQLREKLNGYRQELKTSDRAELSTPLATLAESLVQADSVIPAAAALVEPAPGPAGWAALGARVYQPEGQEPLADVTWGDSPRIALAAQANRKQLEVRGLGPGEPVCRATLEDEIAGLAFTPDGQELAIVRQDGRVELRLTADCERRCALFRPKARRQPTRHRLSFSPDGEWLAVTPFEQRGTDPHIKVLRRRPAQGGEAKCSRLEDTGRAVFRRVQTQGVFTALRAPESDAPHLIASGPGTSLRKWRFDGESWHQAGNLRLRAWPYALAAVPGPDSAQVVVGTSCDETPSERCPRSVIVWNLATMNRRPGGARPQEQRPPGQPPEQVQLVGHRGKTSRIAVSRDGRYVATGGRESRVRIYDLNDVPRKARRTGAGAVRLSAALTVPGHQERVRALALSGNGRHLGTVDDAGTLRFFDLEKSARVGDPVPLLVDAPEGQVTALWLKPGLDEFEAVIISEDGRVQIWRQAEVSAGDAAIQPGRLERIIARKDALLLKDDNGGRWFGLSTRGSTSRLTAIGHCQEASMSADGHHIACLQRRGGCGEADQKNTVIQIHGLGEDGRFEKLPDPVVKGCDARQTSVGGNVLIAGPALAMTAPGRVMRCKGEGPIGDVKQTAWAQARPRLATRYGSRVEVHDFARCVDDGRPTTYAVEQSKGEITRLALSADGLWLGVEIQERADHFKTSLYDLSGPPPDGALESVHAWTRRTRLSGLRIGQDGQHARLMQWTAERPTVRISDERARYWMLGDGPVAAHIDGVKQAIPGPAAAPSLVLTLDGAGFARVWRLLDEIDESSPDQQGRQVELLALFTGFDGAALTTAAFSRDGRFVLLADSEAPPRLRRLKIP